MEPLAHLSLGVESLDDAQTTQTLLDVRHQQAPLVLLLQRLAFEPLADLTHHHSGQRQEYQHEYRQLPRDDDHHHQADYDHYGVFEHHVERRHDGVLDFPDITRHAGHHVTLALLGEKRNRQGHHLVEHIVADVAHDAAAHRNHEVGGQERHPGLQPRHHHQQGGQQGERHRRAIQVDSLLGVIVEVVDRHILERPAPGGHVGVSGLPYLEEHLQDRDDDREGEQRQECRQHIEEDIQREILLVGRHKPLQYYEKIIHNLLGISSINKSLQFG